MATTKEHREEIMGLKFGCMVKILTDDSDFYGKCKPEWNTVRIIKVSPKKAVFDVIWQYPNPEIDYKSRIDAKELKIIGRDINIEDVLRAIGNFQCGELVDIYLHENTIRLTFPNKSEEFIYWLPGLPAHLQSEETLITLTKLLS